MSTNISFPLTPEVTFSCPVATTLPPPPTQPTSDSNETPPTTTQQPEEPTTVSPPTTNSPNNNNDQRETEPDSQVASTTGVVSSVPYDSETATDRQISSSDANVGLIVGLAITLLVVVVMALILVLVAVHIASTKLKKRTKELTASFPTDTNQAYGVATPCEEITYEEESMYNYPEVVTNSAHVGIATEMNEAYSTTTQFNEAYATNIVPSENEAYIATTITTDKNLAYGSFGKSETENESNYMYEFCQ